jgi:excisionase family DNA binding protein
MPRRNNSEPITPIPDPYLQPTMTIEDASRILGISRTAAYTAAKTGDIPTIKIGRRTLVPTARLREMLGIDHPDKSIGLKSSPQRAVPKPD